jgi:hypothetical protein
MRRRGRPALAFSLLIALGGCAITPPPHGYPEGALALTPAQPYHDTVNCRRKDCERWYRMRVDRKGTFVVDIAGYEAGRTLPQYSVLLTDHTGDNVLARESNLEQSRVRFDRGVGADTYLVGIVAPPKAGGFRFRVTLDFAAATPAAPSEPPPPQYELHTSSVLESVGYGQDAVAVLIESGRKHGMRVGFRGRLIDGGTEIGRVVIEQVYPDGSRARIDGALIAPVTYETVVEIDVPVGLAPGDEEGGGQP